MPFVSLCQCQWQCCCCCCRCCCWKRRRRQRRRRQRRKQGRRPRGRGARSKWRLLGHCARWRASFVRARRPNRKPTGRQQVIGGRESEIFPLRSFRLPPLIRAVLRPPRLSGGRSPSVRPPSPSRRPLCCASLGSIGGQATQQRGRARRKACALLTEPLGPSRWRRLKGGVRRSCSLELRS